MKITSTAPGSATSGGPAQRHSAFFAAFAALVVIVALIGFSKTFFVPLFSGAFTAPLVKWIHAALMFSWTLLFLAQTIFIRAGVFQWHRTLGLAGAVLAALIIPFTIATGLAVLPRDLAQMGEGAYSAFLPTVIEAFLFGSLVAAAIAMRTRPDFHKRLMLLATLSALGPAWFRFRHFFPGVENSLVIFGFWLALAPMFVAVLWDWRRTGSIHPVFLTVLPAMISIYVVEVWGSSHPVFVAAAKQVAALLS